MPGIVDPTPWLKAELERDLAPLRAALAAEADKARRRELKRQMRELRRDARRRGRAPW